MVMGFLTTPKVLATVTVTVFLTLKTQTRTATAYPTVKRTGRIPVGPRRLQMTCTRAMTRVSVMMARTTTGTASLIAGILTASVRQSVKTQTVMEFPMTRRVTGTPTVTAFPTLRTPMLTATEFRML